MDTDAQEIARYFTALTGIQHSHFEYSRIVMIAKQILLMRHSKSDIIRVIDYLIKRKRVRVTSLVYVKKCMDDVLYVLLQEDKQEEMRIAVENMHNNVEKVREVRKENESTERNRNKARRFGVKSGFREEHYLNLLKGSE